VKIVVERDAAALGLRNSVAVALSGIRIITESNVPVVVEQTVEALRSEAAGVLGRPEVVGFRELFAALGYRRQVPAGERLLMTVLERGFKPYNNLVDAYNVASMAFGSGLGVHDAGRIRGDVRVMRAEGTELIVPLFKSAPSRLSPGDLLYRDDSQILAWLGRKDVDSDAARVTESTSTVLLMALGNGRTSREYNAAAAERVCALLRPSCPELVVRPLCVEYP
jgi:DNA/RNA-binding domain of Phe-tRNA-synthetase-like protein